MTNAVLRRLRRAALVVGWGAGVVLALAAWHRDVALAVAAIVCLGAVGVEVRRRWAAAPRDERHDHARIAVLNNPMR
jgi:hypothetical protein